jgi:hypothetical protein
MGSFKLEKSGSAKDQARTGGVFLAIIGVVIALFVWPVVGWVMVVLGLLFFAASFAASE